MLEIYVKDIHFLSGLLKNLQDALGVDLREQHTEHILSGSNKNVKGAAHSGSFKDGLGYLNFEAVFKEDVTMNMDMGDSSRIYFFYCLEGRTELQLDPGLPHAHLERYQSTIVSASIKDHLILKFNKGEQVSMNIICMDSGFFLNARGYITDSEDPLNRLFNELDQKKMFFSGNYDPKIAELVRQLQNIGSDGLLRDIVIENQVNRILASHLRYYLLDAHKEQYTSGMTKSEMEKAIRMAEYIRLNPNKNHDIKTLSRLEGLSPAKMQVAFRHLYGHTVSNFVKEERLKKAEELIRSTDLSISEVVYAVGFNSRSYFSKIFKEKYKYSPKRYKNRK